MKFDLTFEMRAANERVVALKDLIPAVMRPTPWYRTGYSMAERTVFIREFADARAHLFSLVERQYPVLAGRSYSVGSRFIECSELPETADAVDPSAASTGTPSTRD